MLNVKEFLIALEEQKFNFRDFNAMSELREANERLTVDRKILDVYVSCSKCGGGFNLSLSFSANDKRLSTYTMLFDELGIVDVTIVLLVTRTTVSINTRTGCVLVTNGSDMVINYYNDITKVISNYPPIKTAEIEFMKLNI